MPAVANRRVLDGDAVAAAAARAKLCTLRCGS